MQTVNVNGRTETIFDNKDICELVEQNCGSDLANLLVDRLIDVDKEKLYAEAKACTDAEAYESELESFRNLMCEVRDTIDELTEYIEEAKRINKDNIYQKLCRLSETINHEL